VDSEDLEFTGSVRIQLKVKVVPLRASGTGTVTAAVVNLNLKQLLEYSNCASTVNKEWESGANLNAASAST
jgi:hypothetical protein